MDRYYKNRIFRLECNRSSSLEKDTNFYVFNFTEITLPEVSNQVNIKFIYDHNAYMVIIYLMRSVRCA